MPFFPLCFPFLVKEFPKDRLWVKRRGIRLRWEACGWGKGFGELGCLFLAYVRQQARWGSLEPEPQEAEVGGSQVRGQHGLQNVLWNETVSKTHSFFFFLMASRMAQAIKALVTSQINWVLSDKGGRELTPMKLSSGLHASAMVCKLARTQPHTRKKCRGEKLSHVIHLRYFKYYGTHLRVMPSHK